MIFEFSKQKPRFRQIQPAMESLMTKSDLNAGFHHHTAKSNAALRLLKTPPPQIN